MSGPMKLYVHRVLNHGEGNWTHGYELATSEQILEAARPHAERVYIVKGRAKIGKEGYIGHVYRGEAAESYAKNPNLEGYWAALGADDEEDEDIAQLHGNREQLDYEAALSDLRELAPDAALSDAIRIVSAAFDPDMETAFSLRDPGLWVWKEDGTGTGTGDMHPATTKNVLNWLREHGIHAVTYEQMRCWLHRLGSDDPGWWAKELWAHISESDPLGEVSL